MGTENSPQIRDERGREKPPVALIAGPTASGKSDVAVRLALRLIESGRGAVIINADSAQVYRDLRVLSARPSEDEMQCVPHRLFGTWDGARACSAADWAKAAKREIAEAHAAGAVPILVGGTGMYMQVLLDGIAEIPAIDAAIRETVRALPTPAAYAALEREDPERAAMLAPADSQRIARALEVIRSTGSTMGQWQTRNTGGIAGDISLAPLILTPDRSWVYERCDRRFGIMLDAGAIPEVEALLARGLSPDLPVMRAIGVREIAGELRGDWARQKTMEQATQATRNYAKRQSTWFRRQLPPDWPRLDPSPEATDSMPIPEIFAILFQYQFLTG